MATDTSGQGEHTRGPQAGFFDCLTFLERHPGSGRVADFASGQTVYAQGDLADHLYCLVSGTVRISVYSERGKEGVIALLGPGSFFGEGCLNHRPLRTTTVTATSACKIACIQAESVARALREDPAFSRVFVNFLIARNEKLKDDLIDQLFNSSEKRLARILLTLANSWTGPESNRLPISVNQEVLANMVGTTRPRINQFMNKFRKLGYVEYDDDIKVHDSLINVILRGNDE